MTNAEALVASIATPGRTLALCDETDLTIGATSTMVAQIHAWVAMIVPSERYAALASALAGYQDEYGLPEVHGNEIVNPGSGSAWKPIARKATPSRIASPCSNTASSGLPALALRPARVDVKSRLRAVEDTEPIFVAPSRSVRTGRTAGTTV